MDIHTLIILTYVFVLAVFLGFELIFKVPALLHTPLMSATNAISGISLVASLVLVGGKYSTAGTILGTVAVAAATIKKNTNTYWPKSTCALLFKYLPFFVDASHHNIHHQRAKGNYASMLRYLDWVFNTAIK